MIVAVQQPEHLPWLGFFDKMLRSDLFVYLDNVQFKKRYFENRNRILTASGPRWITVPVYTRGRYRQKIRDVDINEEHPWRNKYLESIRHAYCRAPYFENFSPDLFSIVKECRDKLADLNIRLIECLRAFFGIETPVIRASEIRDYDETGSALILAICRDLEAATYLSGPDGRNYLDLEGFESAGIRVAFHDFKHPSYRQLHEPFVSHMSASDYLFNEGERLPFENPPGADSDHADEPSISLENPA